MTIHSGSSEFPRDDFLARLSVNQMTTRKWDFEEDITFYPQAGFRYMGVNRQKLHELHHDCARHLLEESGLKVSSLSWVGGFTRDNDFPLKEAIKECREYIEISRHLNARTLTIVSGSQANHIRPHAKRLIVDTLRQLGYYAGEWGLELALMPMHRKFHEQWTFLHCLSDAVELIERVNLPNVGLCVNLFQLGGKQLCLEEFKSCIPHIKSMQLNDVSGKPASEWDQYPPGQGQLPLGQILHLLYEHNYQGLFEFDIWSDRYEPTSYNKLLKDCYQWAKSVQPTRPEINSPNRSKTV